LLQRTAARRAGVGFAHEAILPRVPRTGIDRSGLLPRGHAISNAQLLPD
jgi:hypothetical protein